MPSSILSSKARGKRPMHGPNVSRASSSRVQTPSENIDDIDDYASVASGSASVNSRRVQPVRARRGMAANALLGSNDVDKKLLDTLRRKGENEPLIPARTPFILTTDASLLASSSKKTSLSLNTDAEQFYFERPEVIQAIRTQREVQSAGFRELRDEDLVSGRLRYKGDTEPWSLSDTAFEKRHGRYEKIEKKQKAREKEQLQFEHFKLRERMDQLRNMETSPFLSLPADFFLNVDTKVVVDKPTSVSHIGFGLSAAAHQEGERRRHIILQVASSLDERYRMLLPPKPDGRRETISRESSEVEFDETVEDSASRDHLSQHEEDVEMADEEGEQINEEPPSPVRAPKKLKASKPLRATPSLSRRSRKSTPSSDIDVRAPRPREGIFDRDTTSASLVLKQKPTETERLAPARTRRQVPAAIQVPLDEQTVQAPSQPVMSMPGQPYGYVLPPVATQQLTVPMLYDQATQSQHSQSTLAAMSMALVQPPELHRLFSLHGAQLQNVLSARGNMSESELDATVKTFEVMQRQYQFPPFEPRATSFSGIRKQEKERISTMTIEVDAPSTPSDDMEPPPFSPVPVIPEQHDSPSAVFGNRSEYDFEQQRRFRATEVVDSDSYVADSLSRSSVPRTTASVDGGYDRRQSTPATASSSMMPEPGVSYRDNIDEFKELKEAGFILHAKSYHPELTATGRIRRWPAELIKISKYNDEPKERRHGRSNPKPFGVETPLAEPGTGVKIDEFELPAWLLQDAALLRARDYEGSNGSPLVKPEDFGVGEWCHGSFIIGREETPSDEDCEEVDMLESEAEPEPEPDPMERRMSRRRR